VSDTAARAVLGAALTPHPKGVRRLHTGCCTKGYAAVPDLTVTLVNKRNLRVVRKESPLTPRTLRVLDDFTRGVVRKGMPLTPS
jgi:hypothetical protein